MPASLRVLTVPALLMLLGVVLGAVALLAVLTPTTAGGRHITTIGAGKIHPDHGVVWN